MSLSSIASGSLITYKYALETVANNIANVNTEGYSRQDASFKAQASEKVGNSYVGKGVALDDIKRYTAPLKLQAMRDSHSDYTQQTNFYERALSVDNLLAQEGTSVSANLTSLFESLDSINETPDSLASRELFIAQSNFFVDQTKQIQEIIIDEQDNLALQLGEVASQVTSLAQEVADLNRQITTGSKSPELLDKRDSLIFEISTFTNVSTVEQTNGAINVMIGKGESLVTGNVASTMYTDNDPEDGATSLFLKIDESFHPVSNSLSGGVIQGLVSYEEDILHESSRQLGLISMAMADNFNTQNKLGMDLNNELGENLFTDYNAPSLQTARAFASSFNSDPTNDISVKIDSTNELVNSDYQLKMTGSLTGYLTRESDNKSFAVTFTSTATPTLATVDGNAQTSIDGFELNFDAAAVTGDSFNISPTKDMTVDLKFLATSAEKIALASPVRAYASFNNASEGQIKIETVSATDTTLAPNLSNQFEVRILETDSVANTFSYEIFNATTSITDAGPITAGYGNSINIPNAGYSVFIEGPAKVGDVYNTEFNNDGFADNSNGLLLAELSQKSLINNGTESLFDRYSSLVSEVGTQTYQAKIRQESSEILFNQSEAQVLSVTGVNLDEEAASLLNLQQAYQASAKLLTIIEEMIDTLMRM